MEVELKVEMVNILFLLCNYQSQLYNLTYYAHLTETIFEFIETFVHENSGSASSVVKCDDTCNQTALPFSP